MACPITKYLYQVPDCQDAAKSEETCTILHCTLHQTEPLLYTLLQSAGYCETRLIQLSVVISTPTVAVTAYTCASVVAVAAAASHSCAMQNLLLVLHVHKPLSWPAHVGLQVSWLWSTVQPPLPA